MVSGGDLNKRKTVDIWRALPSSYYFITETRDEWFQGNNSNNSSYIQKMSFPNSYIIYLNSDIKALAERYQWNDFTPGPANKSIATNW